MCCHCPINVTSFPSKIFGTYVSGVVFERWRSVFFPGFIGLSARRKPPGELLHRALPSRGEQICGPGWRGAGAKGAPRVRCAPPPCVPGAAVKQPRGGNRPGPAPLPPRRRPRPGQAHPAPAPLRARSLSVRALGRCQRGAPEGGRSAARRVWFRRGCEGGGELWPWGFPSSTGGSRSGTPASARCWRNIRWAGGGAALPDTGPPRRSWRAPRRDGGGGERAGPVPGRPCGTESQPGPARPQPGRCGSAGSAVRSGRKRWDGGGRSLGSGEAFGAPWTARLPGRARRWQAAVPAAGTGDGCSSPRPSALFPRGAAGPRRVPARGRPAAPPGSLPSLWVPSAAPRRCLSPRRPRIRGEPEVGVYSLLGSEKLQLLTANGAVMTRDRFYSSAAFPSCRLRRTVCVSSWTGKYVQAWKTRAVNHISNSWTKTSSFQRWHVWYLLDISASNYHFQLVSQMWFYRLSKDLLR